jgi:hypothetical protein
MDTFVAPPDIPPTRQSFRARWRCGRIDWICPNCGTIHQDGVRTWVVECSSCGTVLGLALMAYRLRPGPGSRQFPPDYHVPLGEMIKVEIMPERYRRGEPAHRLIE